MVGPVGLPTRFFGLANLGLAVVLPDPCPLWYSRAAGLEETLALGPAVAFRPGEHDGRVPVNDHLGGIDFRVCFSILKGCIAPGCCCPWSLCWWWADLLLAVVAARDCRLRSSARWRFYHSSPIDPLVRNDTQGSTEWRLEMWRDVLPEIPQYLLVGKGYSFSGTEQCSRTRNWRLLKWLATITMGPCRSFCRSGSLARSLSSGFWCAGIGLLYQNYRFGDPAYQHINTFLFAYFVAKVIFFFDYLRLPAFGFAPVPGVAGPEHQPQRRGGKNLLPSPCLSPRAPSHRLRPHPAWTAVGRSNFVVRMPALMLSTQANMPALKKPAPRVCRTNVS